MKRLIVLLTAVLSLTALIPASAQTAQPTTAKMERNPDGTFKKKADKIARNPDGTFKSKGSKMTGPDSQSALAGQTKAGGAEKEEKATAADYKAPVDKSQKGPNGEAVYTGPRGGKYYITKAGGKKYLAGKK